MKPAKPPPRSRRRLAKLVLPAVLIVTVLDGCGGDDGGPAPDARPDAAPVDSPGGGLD